MKKKLIFRTCRNNKTTITGKTNINIALCCALGVGIGGVGLGTTAPSNSAERLCVAAETDFSGLANASSVEAGISDASGSGNSGNSETLTLASDAAPLDLSPLPTGEEKIAEFFINMRIIP